MHRPLWVWLVLIISLFSGCSSFVSGGSGLFTTVFPNVAVEGLVKIRERAAQLPDGGGIRHEQLQQLDQQIARVSQLAGNPFYIAQGVTMAIIQVALGFGFLIGLVRLYRLEFGGVTLLQVSNVVAILCNIVALAVQHFTGVIPNLAPNQPGVQTFVLVLSLFFSSLWYLVPLLLLTFCSKAEFVSERR